LILVAVTILAKYIDRNKNFQQSFFSADAPSQALQFYDNNF